MAPTRRTYTRDFKVAAVKLITAPGILRRPRLAETPQGEDLAAFFFCVGLIAGAISLEEAKVIPKQAGGWACLGGVVLIVLWLVAVFVLQHRSFRPTSITDHEIRFANVSPEFVEAMERKREQWRRPEWEDDEPLDVEPAPPERRESFREGRDPDRP